MIVSSTPTLVTLLRPWIRRLTIIISAWWLRTSSKFTWEEVKTSTGNLGKWSTPKRVRIRPRHSAPSLSRDKRIKMHQSINQLPVLNRLTDIFAVGKFDYGVMMRYQNLKRKLELFRSPWARAPLGPGTMYPLNPPLTGPGWRLAG